MGYANQRELLILMKFRVDRSGKIWAFNLGFFVLHSGNISAENM
jgi:hypothetical protein